MSRKALTFPEPLFTWVFVHEQRHVFQSREAIDLTELKKTIEAYHRRQEFIVLPKKYLAADEIDCEIHALRTVRQLMGDVALEDFRNNISLPRYPYPPYFALLEALAKHAYGDDLQEGSA